MIPTQLEYWFGPFRVVDDGRALLRDGEAVPISPKVLAVLVELLRVPGRVVSKTELLETVWAGSFVEDGNLTQSISVLRKLLASGFAESPIETLPRVGYRFRSPVQIVDPSAVLVQQPSPTEVTSPVAVTASVSAHVETDASEVFVRRWNQPWAFMLTLTCLVAIAGVSVVSLRLRSRVLADNRQMHRRVAVLSFRDLAQSPSTAWLGVAFQETVGTDLAANSDLEIIPVDDVERAERELNIADSTGFTAATLKTLCGNLSCDYVVTGSYLATGDSVRLDTHLLNAQDGSSLGSDTETQPLNRLLPLIAANSRALRSQFGLPASTSDDGQGAVSAAPEAFASYSKGLEQMKLYDGPAALKFFERSISLDPNFPLAHLAYSSALTIAGHEEQAAGQARIAQSLSSNLSRRMQLAIEARCEQTEHHFDLAATTFQTLSTFYPEDMEYVWMRAAMLQDGGHPDQAVSLLLQAVNDDAQSNGRVFGSEGSRDPRLYSQLSDAYALSGDWPASLRWARAGVDEARRRGAFVLYERMLTSESQAELYMNQLPQAEVATREALRLARKFSDRSGELRALNRMGQVQSAQGKFSEARNLLKQALTIEEAGGEIQRQIHTLSALGQTLFSLGDRAGAKAAFAHELKLAQTFSHPATTLGAELDVAREETMMGDQATGIEHLVSIGRRAQEVGNKQLQIEADTAIRKVSSEGTPFRRGRST